MHKRAVIIKIASKPPRVSQSKRKAIRNIEIVHMFCHKFFSSFVKKIWGFGLLLIDINFSFNMYSVNQEIKIALTYRLTCSPSTAFLSF